MSLAARVRTLAYSPSLSLVAGQVVGQAALVLVVPLITRAYSPSTVGLYQLAFALSLTLQPLATLRLEYVIPASASRADAFKRAQVGRLTTTSIFLAIGLIGVALSLQENPSYPDVVLSGAMLIAVQSWTVLDNAILIYENQLRRLSARNLLSGVVAAGLQAVSVFAEFDSALLLAGSLAVGRASALLLTSYRPRSAKALDGGKVNYEARRASSAILSGVISNSSTQVLFYSVYGLFSVGSAGQVAVAQRVAGAPTTLLGQGIGQIVTSRMAPHIRTQNYESLLREVKKVIVGLSALAFIAFGFIVSFSLFALDYVLGPGWDQASTILAILAMPFCLQIIALPLAPLYSMIGREHLLFKIQVVRLIAQVAVTVAVAFATKDLVLACWAAATVWSISYFLIALMLVRVISQRRSHVAVLQ